MREVIAITKAIASAQRIRILLALRDQPLCVSVLTDLLGLAPATVSKHLWMLASAGLVESDKTGRCVCYHLPRRRTPIGICKTLRWLDHMVATDPLILEDATRLKPLVANSPVESWCHQRSTETHSRRPKRTAWATKRERTLLPTT